MTCFPLRFSKFLSLLLGIAFSSLSFQAFPEPAAYKVGSNIFYGKSQTGNHQFQSLDIYWQGGKKRLPVIIYIHGGGWAFGDKSDVGHKPAFFAQHGINFISMNYRLRWEHTLFDQLEDVVSVVRWTRQNADKYGLDPKRIILMGDGAGAHLASMIGMDASLLQPIGLSPHDIRMVVAIDNTGFDIGRLMTDSGNFLEKRRYRLVFGDDQKNWASLSPMSYVGKGKGTPPFAVMYSHGDASAKSQARLFTKSLSEAGVNVIMIPSSEKSREPIDASLGMAGDAPTLALIAFISAAI